MPLQNRLKGLICGLVVLCGAQMAGAQIRTVLVSPVPGNPIASGTALRNALAGIPSPSSTDRWLLKIEPGIFDIGTTPLQMRSWVDMEGSGIGVTTIRGNVFLVQNSNYTATLHGADNAELRLLTVEALGDPAGAIAMANYYASPRLYRVKFTTYTGSATGTVWGIRNFSSAPLIEECEVNVTRPSAPNTTAYGLVFIGNNIPLPAGRSSFLRSKIAVSGASTTYGVYLQNAQIINQIRESRVDVTGSTTTYGLYAVSTGQWVGHESLQIQNSEISSGGSTFTSYGIFFDSEVLMDLDIRDSKVRGYMAPTTYGILQTGSPGTTGISLQGASIVGLTKTIGASANISVASTFLNGGPITSLAWLGCMGVWDENGVFYANSCPP